MRRRSATAALVAAGLLLAACGGSGDPGPSGAVSATPPSAGQPLDFVAPDVRGGEVVGAELAGQELVIWFWAPW